VVGTLPQPTTISLSHSYIERTLGISLSSDEVTTLLKNLAFTVTAASQYTETIYTIGVPTFRASKDITIKNDIVEEIARSYRFERLPLRLPKVDTQARDLTSTMKVRKIKAFLAYGGRMMEQKNYTFFNEKVITSLQWPREASLELTNPVATT